MGCSWNYHPHSTPRSFTPEVVMLLLCFQIFLFFSHCHPIFASFSRSHHGKIAKMKPHAARALPAGWTSVGCVIDGPARVLPWYSFISSSMTQAQCVTECDATGHSYAGIESNKCWCGNKLSNALGTAADPNTCNTPCIGTKFISISPRR